MGAAGRARRPVPAARGLRRAGVGVPDRRRRLPVEPPPDRRGIRLVHRLGRHLRVRGGEHDDRLPRRAVGARRSLGIAVTPNRIVVTGMVLVVVCALAGAFGVDVLGRALAAGIAAEAVASVGDRPRRCCSPSASRTSRLLDAHPRRRGARPAARSVAGLLAALAVGGWVFIGFDACVGRRRGDARARRATCRARSGSRC